MSINRVTNAAKLRKLSARVGMPVIRGFVRWFENQNTVLAFTDETTAGVVPKSGPVERYTDEPVRLLERGFQTGANALKTPQRLAFERMNPQVEWQHVE